jgi:tetratricopeptide (TPR) repeat protein
MTRFSVPRSVQKLVRERFQHKCVVCGEANNTDVAHLYEDATKQTATSDRLVLLRPDYNQALQRAHGKSTPDLLELLPDTLLSGARRSFWAGAYPQGYGQARIAAYLYEQRGDYSEAMECLTEAISAGRPARWGDWLASTICEGARLCKSFEIGFARRWLFLDRVAIVLFDYARWAEAAEVMAAAVDIRSRMKGESYDPQRFKFDRQSSFRRESLIKGSAHVLDRGKPIQFVLAQLKEEADDFLGNGKFDPFITNLDVARNLAASAGDSARSHKYSEYALAYKNKVRHKGALLEHLVGEVEYFARRRDRRTALDYASEAMVLFGKSPSALEPIFDGSPKRLGIHERLERLGISLGELLANGVSVASDLTDVPLALDRNAIKRIVRVVFSNPGHSKG